MRCPLGDLLSHWTFHLHSGHEYRGSMSIEELPNHLQRSLNRVGCKESIIQAPDSSGSALWQRFDGFVYSLRKFADCINVIRRLANGAGEIQRISDNVLDTYNSVISPDHWYAEMLSLVGRKNLALTQPPAIPFDESLLIRWMDVRYNKISVRYLLDRLAHIRYLVRLLAVVCRGM